eukprot:COSAG06_NODE_9132_length_1978_cov_2.985631_3_plen_96_part_01
MLVAPFLSADLNVETLGTNIGKTQKKSGVCLGVRFQPGADQRAGPEVVGHCPNARLRCETRLFLSHLLLKTIILPRQARDKHRKSWCVHDGIILF